MTEPVKPQEPAPLIKWPLDLGAALTVGYLVLIAIGMLHNYHLYRRFGINILDFAEPSDFLLAPFRDPLVIVATLIPVLLIWGYFTAAGKFGERQRVRRRAAGIPIAWWETKEENIPKLRRFGPIGMAITASVWVVSGSMWYQLYAGSRIMMGRGVRVSVETTAGSTESGTDRRPVMLIGTTGRFVFVFRTEDWRTIILPAENILRITPINVARGYATVRPRLIRAMDSTPPAR